MEKHATRAPSTAEHGRQPSEQAAGVHAAAAVKVLVTGSAGALGRSLLRSLRQGGHEVVALSRSGSAIEGHPTTVADVRAAPWERLVEGASAVFHLAAFVHRLPRSAAEREEAREVNHRATAALASACAAAGAKLVFASSVAVLGRGGAGLGDDAPPNPESVYGETKLLGEEAIRAAGSGRLRHAILRLPLLYGPHGRGNMERMLAAIARGRYWPIGDPEVRKSCLHFDDAAEALLLAAFGAEGTYLVAPPVPSRLGEIHAAAYAALGKRAPVPACPTFVAWLAAAAVDVGARLLGKPSRMRDGIETLTRPAWYDGTRFARATGFAPRIALADGLRSTAAWMREAAPGR
jgi:nucleoside-diphosphate-sugar epimerase